MNKKTRRSLILGILFLVVVGTALVLYVNYQSSNVGAQGATLQVGTYSIGTDYGGVITKQFVQQGQQVKAGQPLFYIKSSELVQDLNAGKVQPQDLIYPLTSDRQIIVQATKLGAVQEFAYQLGSFVPDDHEIVTLADTANLSVDAIFKLTPREFGEISTGTPMPVTLPSGARTASTVKSVTILQQGTLLTVEVHASLHGVVYNPLQNSQGTNVAAVLELHHDTLWNRLTQRIHQITHR